MFAVILGMFCIIPTIVGVFRFKQMDASIHPFVYSIWLSVVVEIIARWAWFIKNTLIFSINYNLFMVLNFSLLICFFINLKVIKQKWAAALVALSIALKLAEYHYSSKFQILNLSSIFECVFLALLSIKSLSTIILFNNDQLTRSARFVILVSLLIISLFDILNTILGWVFPISSDLTKNVNSIFVIANALVYLSYTYAILCHPTNKK